MKRLLSLIAFFLSVQTYGLAATYWVSTSGTDTKSNCVNTATPQTTGALRTIEYAFNNCGVGPGDFIRVRSGTYGGNDLDTGAGSAGNHVTIIPYASERVIIDSIINNKASFTITNIGVHHVTIDGFEMTTTHPVVERYRNVDLSVQSGRDIAANGLNDDPDVMATNMPGVGFNSPAAEPWINNITLRNNYIYHSNWGRVGGRGNNILIENNRFEDFFTYAGYSIYVSGRNITIRGNIFQNVVYGLHGEDTAYIGHLDLLVENNVFINAGNMFVTACLPQTPCGQSWGRPIVVHDNGQNPNNPTIIRNNVFYNNVDVNQSIMEVNSARAIIYNNTIFNNRRNARGDGGWPGPTECMRIYSNGTAKNNVCYNNDDNTPYAAFTAANYSSNTSPQFVDISAPNCVLGGQCPGLYPVQASPLINAGTPNIAAPPNQTITITIPCPGPQCR